MRPQNTGLQMNPVWAWQGWKKKEKKLPTDI